MKAIKWIGSINYHGIGALLPGNIYTEEQVPVEVMEAWVAQGVAEWIVAPTSLGEATSTAVDIAWPKEVLKKRKIKEVSHG